MHNQTNSLFENCFQCCELEVQSKMVTCYSSVNLIAAKTEKGHSSSTGLPKLRSVSVITRPKGPTDISYCRLLCEKPPEDAWITANSRFCKRQQRPQVSCINTFATSSEPFTQSVKQKSIWSKLWICFCSFHTKCIQNPLRVHHLQMTQCDYEHFCCDHTGL